MYDWMPPTPGEQLAEIAGIVAAFLGPLALVFGPLFLLLLAH